MKIHHVLLQSLFLVSPALAAHTHSPRDALNLAPTPASSSLPSIPPRPPAPASSPPPAPPSPEARKPKCGRGYTYCGYLLTGNGHNFSPQDVTKAYCSGLPGNCPSGKPKTDASQAVYYCLNDGPGSIRLLCACGGKCLNNPETNHIAHCDKPCTS